MQTIIPFQVIPIENDGFHLQLTIKINNQNAILILDTGASRSVFDENRIKTFTTNHQTEDLERLSTGLGTNTMVSKKVYLEKLQFNELIIKNYEATILDLTHVNHSYQKLNLNLIDGVLGSDILTDFNAIIDYEKKELHLFNKIRCCIKNTGVRSKSWGIQKKYFKFWKKKVIETLYLKLLQNIFPIELMEYFKITGFQLLCNTKTKEEFWEIEFEEKNDLPEGYSST